MKLFRSWEESLEQFWN